MLQGASNLRGLACGLALAVLAGACGPPRAGTPVPARSGYMVLGPVGADAFGYAAGDTLPELPRAQAPAGVIGAAAQKAAEMRYDPLCSRFFGGTPSYVVVLRYRCVEDPGVRYRDGVSIGAYTAAGQAVGQFFGSVPPHVFEVIEPFTRGPAT